MAGCRIKEGTAKTRDIGGTASTTQFVDAVIGSLAKETAATHAGKISKGKSVAV